jgi:hypothetical protein
MTTARTLLAVFAHPDDETFLAGPIIAKYAHEGARVELVVATPNVSPVPALECAAKQLGISRVHYLGYAHSGMPGGKASPDEHGRLVSDERGLLVAAPLDAIAGQIQQILADVKPQVVLTDSPYGAYGHPDHVVVHRAAVRAFRDAFGAVDRTSQPRLYALAFPMPLVRLNLRLLKMRGVPVAGLGPRGDIDLQGAVRSAIGKTGLVAVARYVRYRRLAAGCYEEEIRAAPLPLKLLERSPLWIQRLIFSRQAITRLEPPPEGFERNLLA